MHEWALAEAIISAASEIAKKEELEEVSEVRIRIGELQQIERNILRFALSQLKTDRFNKTRFRMDTDKAQLKCRVCWTTWAFNRKKLNDNASEAIHFIPEIAHIYINCPKCGSPDFEILKGRGILIRSVKGVRRS